jgi:hypothetical protein
MISDQWGDAGVGLFFIREEDLLYRLFVPPSGLAEWRAQEDVE